MKASTSRRTSSTSRSKAKHRAGAGLKRRIMNTTLTSAANQANGEIASLKTRLTGTIAKVKARAKAVATTARQQAKKADKTIRSHPYQTAGVAAGAGLVAGLLLARKRSASA